MPTTAPWYTAGGQVYHVRDDCGQWKNDGTQNRIQGTDNRRVCIDCLVLLVREISLQ